MDGLSHSERALAWAAAWHPSFVGYAIVEKDFTFRAVNPQFCEICGVTPAELIGHKFTDITPEPINSLDKQNAELVMQGVITSYTIEKVYRFITDAEVKTVPITLLVRGVYHPKTSEFLFFLSRIVRGIEVTNEEFTTSPPQPPTLLSYATENKKTIIGIIGSGIAVGLYKLAELAQKTFLQ